MSTAVRTTNRKYAFDIEVGDVIATLFGDDDFKIVLERVTAVRSVADHVTIDTTWKFQGTEKKIGYHVLDRYQRVTVL